MFIHPIGSVRLGGVRVSSSSVAVRNTLGGNGDCHRRQDDDGGCGRLDRAMMRQPPPRHIPPGDAKSKKTVSLTASRFKGFFFDVIF